MASGSTKSKKAKSKKNQNASADYADAFDQDKLKEYLIIGNVHRPDAKPEIRHNMTCFLLPEPVRMHYLDTMLDMVKSMMDMNEFMIFWNQLDDIHKERRLLVNFMCSSRGIHDMFDQFSNDPIAMTLFRIFTKSISTLIWTLRDIFVVKKDQEQFAKRLLEGVLSRSAIVEEFLNRFIKPEESEQMMGPDAARFLLNSVHKIMACFLRGVITTYSGWIPLHESEIGRSVLVQAVRFLDFKSPEEEKLMQKRYLAKLAIAAPHWRAADRAVILKAIATNGRSCPEYNYIMRLLKEIGVERFKVLAFGIEKFCSSCGRSSYVGEERLWACKRCCDEHRRPKARYCNVTCQKAHWIKHKVEVHSIAASLNKVSDMKDIYRCFNCGRRDQLRTCKRCTDEHIIPPARYCDVQCQKAHWSKHKIEAHQKNASTDMHDWMKLLFHL